MRIETILNEESEHLSIEIVKQSDMNEVQKVVDLFNEVKLVPWRMTGGKMVRKVGKLGTILAVRSGGTIVGCALVKQTEFGDDYVAGDVSHLYVAPEHRNEESVKALLVEAFKHTKNFDFAFITTNVKSKTMNQLVYQYASAKDIFHFKTDNTPTPYICWLYTKSKMGFEEAKSVLEKEYRTKMVP